MTAPTPTAAPFPLSEATRVLADLVALMHIAGPEAFLQAADWVIADIVTTYFARLGIPIALVPGSAVS